MKLIRLDSSIYEVDVFLERVMALRNHLSAESGDYGVYFYRHRPFFYVREYGSSFRCFWFTLQRGSFEKYPVKQEVFNFFLKFPLIQNLVADLKPVLF